MMPLPPFPGDLEPAAPDPQRFAASLLFLRPVSPAAVMGVIDGPPAPNHGRVQFAALGAAHGDDAAVAVMIPCSALDPPTARQLTQNRRCISAAFVGVSILPLAGLLSLGRVDTPKPDPRIGYADRIPVYHTCGSRQLRRYGGIAE